MAMVPRWQFSFHGSFREGPTAHGSAHLSRWNTNNGNQGANQEPAAERCGLLVGPSWGRPIGEPPARPEIHVRVGYSRRMPSGGNSVGNLRQSSDNIPRWLLSGPAPG